LGVTKKGGLISTKFADINSLIPNLVQRFKDLPPEEAEQFIRDINKEVDPTGKEANYTPWIIDQFRKGSIELPEQNEEIRKLLRLYDLNRKRPEWQHSTDIYQFDYNSLKQAIEELKETGRLREKSLKEISEEIKKKGAEEIYNDGIYRVIKCTTPEAAVKYGYGTRWCTTNINEARKYLKESPLYRIFKNNKIYASFYPPGMSVKDISDTDISLRRDVGLRRIIESIVDIEMPNLMKHPGYAYHHAKDVIKGRWSEAEPYIMRDPEYAYKYAKNIIKDRWVEAEPYIMKSPKYAYLYAKNIIQGRWPEAEPYIMKDPIHIIFYINDIIKGRWPEAEPYIVKDPCAACWYAKYIIRGRWLEAEPWILKSDYWAREYAKNAVRAKNPTDWVLQRRRELGITKESRKRANFEIPTIQAVMNDVKNGRRGLS